MPYFRELPLKTILWMNFLLGLASGWFFVQGIKLMLGLCVFGGLQLKTFFYRLLGLQLSFLVFVIVWVVDQTYWKNHRVRTDNTPTSAAEVKKLCLTLLSYAIGGGIINLVRFL